MEYKLIFIKQSHSSFLEEWIIRQSFNDLKIKKRCYCKIKIIIMCQIGVNACNLYRGNTCCFREVQQPQPQEKTYRCYYLVATRPPLPLIQPPLHPFQIIRTMIKKTEQRKCSFPSTNRLCDSLIFIS